MIKRLWALYVPDRNHLALYLYSFFNNLAFSIIVAFTGAWMFSLGIKLHWILLCYALQFGFMGLFSPLGLKFVLRYGALYTVLVSNGVTFLGCFSIGMMHHHAGFAAIGMLLLALSSGLLNPLNDVVQAIYAHDAIRSRNIALMTVLTSLASMIGISLGGWILVHFSFMAVAFLCAAFLLCGALPFRLLEERIKGSLTISFRAAYGETLQPEMRRYIPAFLGEQFSVITWVVLVPIFLYILAHSFETMTLVLVLSIAIETIVMLAFGHWMDGRRSREPLLYATSGHAGALVFYAFCAHTPFLLIFAETSRRLTTNLFGTAFRTALHRHIKRTQEHMIVFGTVWQIVLCFGELITLSLFALCAFFFGTAILPWLLVCCAFGTFIAYKEMVAIEASSAPKEEQT